MFISNVVSLFSFWVQANSEEVIAKFTDNSWKSVDKLVDKVAVEFMDNLADHTLNGAPCTFQELDQTVVLKGHGSHILNPQTLDPVPLLPFSTIRSQFPIVRAPFPARQLSPSCIPSRTISRTYSARENDPQLPEASPLTISLESTAHADTTQTAGAKSVAKAADAGLVTSGNRQEDARFPAPGRNLTSGLGKKKGPLSKATSKKYPKFTDPKTSVKKTSAAGEAGAISSGRRTYSPSQTSQTRGFDSVRAAGAKRKISEVGTSVDEMVINLVQKLTPSPLYETAAREAMIAVRRMITRCLGKNVEFIVFGSILQSTHVEGSDVDLCIEVPGARNDNSDYKLRILRVISARATAMSNGRLRVRETRINKFIKIPLVVLDFYCMRTGIEIQIDLSVGFAGNSTGVTDTVVREVLTRRPAAVHLIRIVKLWAKVRGLNNAYDRYLNSAGWTLLVLYHLMQDDMSVHSPLPSYSTLDVPGPKVARNGGLPSPIVMPEPDPSSLKNELQGFFKWCGEFRDWPQDLDSHSILDKESPSDHEGTWGVSVVSGKAVRGPEDRSPFYIENPGPAALSNLSQNVARSLAPVEWLKTVIECERAGAKLKSATGFTKWITALNNAYNGSVVVTEMMPAGDVAQGDRKERRVRNKVNDKDKSKHPGVVAGQPSIRGLSSSKTKPESVDVERKEQMMQLETWLGKLEKQG